MYVLKDINGRELSKVFRISDAEIMNLLYGRESKAEAYFDARKKRHKKRMLDLDNRKYMFTSDLDVVSMMLDAIKKPMNRS